MPDRMPDNMLECIGDKMSWNFRKHVRIFATVGITGSEALVVVAFVFFIVAWGIFNVIDMKDLPQP